MSDSTPSDSNAVCATCTRAFTAHPPDAPTTGIHPPPESVADHSLSCLACAGERAAFQALYSDIADLQRHRDYLAINVVLTTAKRLPLDLLIGLLTVCRPSRDHLMGYLTARTLAMKKARAAGMSSEDVRALFHGL